MFCKYHVFSYLKFPMKKILHRWWEYMAFFVYYRQKKWCITVIFLWKKIVFFGYMGAFIY